MFLVSDGQIGLTALIESEENVMKTLRRSLLALLLTVGAGACTSSSIVGPDYGPDSGNHTTDGGSHTTDGGSHTTDGGSHTTDGGSHTSNGGG